MNINDVTEVPGVQDKLVAIFNRQQELMEKYHHIEEKSGLLQTPDVPVNLHDPKGQARLKDFAWRTIEEIAESIDAILIDGLDVHAKEEVADSLHFLVEMGILSGITPSLITSAYGAEFIYRTEDSLDYLWAMHGGLPQEIEGIHTRIGSDLNIRIIRFVKELGMTCHTLKNKPWKQTHMLTDVTEYQRRYVSTFFAFADLCIAMGITAEEMYNLYFRKSEVNKFRQRSQY